MTESVNTPINEAGGDDHALTLAHYAERAYLDYAVSVVKGRALPEVADGQKPVQRRILYAMDAMGLGPTAKPVKSARVVGDVLGRFHPHGDTAAYEALVRMAQSFTLRYPLIDGQGNFGSRDGDGAAAMRYTEARLTVYARLLLDEIDEGTVDFVANYDGSTQEPRLLPARLPMVLLNGASGIAVGMATEIPSHNLTELAQAVVHVLRQPAATLDEVLERMPGPDFPGGGHIISGPAELREIYASGRGSIKLRARHTIEELARGQWQLVMTELPHGVSSAKVLEEIEDLSNPKIKLGKKTLTPDQVQLKQTLLGVLDGVRDESGREAAVRLVFEPRSSRQDPAALLATLLAHTSLESSIPVNLVMIGGDGRPQQKPLLHILTEWVAFRLATVTRRTQDRLARVNDRIHILEGRQQVLLHIDEVIRVIRESDEPKPALMQAFGLTDRQADDILEIRLRQLARLEALRIEKELQGLRTDQAGLAALLASEATLRRQVIREIELDAKQYGDARRTLIAAAARTVAEVRIVQEPVTVIVSEKGWVRARQGHGHDASLFTFKTGDAFDGAYEVMTTDYVWVLGSNGRVYSVPVASLPSARGDGVPVTTLIELEAGTRGEFVLAAPSNAPCLLSTRRGYGLVCQTGDWLSRNKSGRQFLTLELGDAPRRPLIMAPSAQSVLCLKQSPEAVRMLVFGVDELKTLKNGGRGTSLMALQESEALTHLLLLVDEPVTLQGIGRGAKPMSRVMNPREWAEYRALRGRAGKVVEPRWREVVVHRTA